MFKSKICSGDYIKNPRTGNCVLKSGKTGKEILAAKKLILNPTTKRLVKQTGKVGKQLLQGSSGTGVVHNARAYKTKLQKIQAEICMSKLSSDNDIVNKTTVELYEKLFNSKK